MEKKVKKCANSVRTNRVGWSVVMMNGAVGCIINNHRRRAQIVCLIIMDPSGPKSNRLVVVVVSKQDCPP